MSVTRRKFPDLPPIWALAVMLAAIIIGRLVWPGPFERRAYHALGVLLMLGGFGLILWAAIWFRRKRTSILPGEQPKTLIVEGPFRINRNPVYTGIAFAVIGGTFIWGGPAGLIVAALYPLLVTRRFILREEAALRAAFDEKAESYIARTRRW
ncbi:isoprenylcysteine carboxylmethyltransferase family protein [Paracoccus aurantiacus]|uniref:Isoprenylcysteine carboxylmethyltransferase family protein n=1 Tax=Paracoccus aurantiacus TaxID=2599412 RepID=A0A5C6S427_9RHOB|nr:isoprenylcysteine carboxylmethyltransferase family protein [Paracoccus aurantiacus]TXB68730.1 isoprenylcysteine carboxylmethyltransferase family protein [Paracoccus aurantiacus]